MAAWCWTWADPAYAPVARRTGAERSLPVTPVERSHLEKSVQITCRMAGPDDSRDIARFMCIAGGGVYEFLFDDLIPFVTAVDLLSSGIGGEQYPISYRNCCVASLGHDGEIVAAANVFPASAWAGRPSALLGGDPHVARSPGFDRSWSRDRLRRRGPRITLKRVRSEQMRCVLSWPWAFSIAFCSFCLRRKGASLQTATCHRSSRSGTCEPTRSCGP